jgi:class 3 adenylate cyclase/predicted ATPase
MDLSQYPRDHVTFMYTDIEGASRMTEEFQELGLSFQKLLNDPHLELLLGLAAKAGGHKLNYTGDGLLLVFPSADSAVACATELQQQLHAGKISYSQEGKTWNVTVRIGLHTSIKELGPKTVPSGDITYPGSDINFAHRIMRPGAGGQLLISRETHRACKTLAHNQVHPWPDRCLKSFEDQPEPVYEVLYYEGQEPREPGLRFFPNFYRRALNQYIRRPDKEAEVRGHFRRSSRDGTLPHLVTIRAEGGMGKTRLAIECAMQMASLFPDGIFLADLSTLTTSTEATVAGVIGEALHLEPQFRQPEPLIQYLAQKDALLLLDNYEGVAGEEVQFFLSDILERTERVRFLVTSRQPVGIDDIEQMVDLDHGMSRAEARELFEARARLKAGNSKVFSETDQQHIEHILDLTSIQPGDANSGVIPLAVELAAAWVGREPLAGIARGLATPASLQTARPRGTISANSRSTGRRHDSLTNSFEWSYHLLGEGYGETAQILFATAGLFATSFDAAILGEITGDPKAVDLVREIRNLSLFRGDDSGDTMRYWLHHFTQEFALSKFKQLERREELERRFVERYARIVDETSNLNEAPNRALLDQEWRNILAAIEVAGPHDWNDLRWQLYPVFNFLSLRSLWGEEEQLQLRYTEWAKERRQPQILNAVQNNLGKVYRVQGRWDEAIQAYKASLLIVREFGDRLGEGQTLNNLGLVYQAQSRWDEAIQVYEASLLIRREFGDRLGEGKALGNLALLWLAQGDLQRALIYAEQSLVSFGRTQDTILQQRARNLIAHIRSQMP